MQEAKWKKRKKTCCAKEWKDLKKKRLSELYKIIRLGEKLLNHPGCKLIIFYLVIQFLHMWDFGISLEFRHMLGFRHMFGISAYVWDFGIYLGFRHMFGISESVSGLGFRQINLIPKLSFDYSRIQTCFGMYTFRHPTLPKVSKAIPYKNK